ncbi:MAG: hypothetical protein AABY32_07320 [Nanoarchaeota archaeon]
MEKPTLTKEKKVFKEYFISDKRNWDIHSPEVHNQFKDIYGKNIISDQNIILMDSEDPHLVSYPEITGTEYNYCINGVNLTFNSFNPFVLNPGKCLSSKISLQGSEKKVNELVENIKSKFYIEQN